MKNYIILYYIILYYTIFISTMKGFDLGELIKRLFKYIFIGFIVAIVSFVIPKRSLDIAEIILISLSAGATFAILDAYMPAVGLSARGGFGLGTGIAMSPLVGML